MENLENLKNLTKQLAEEAERISLDSGLNELEKKRAEAEDFKKRWTEANEKVTGLEKENENLKIAMKQILRTERNGLINSVKNKTAGFFNSGNAEGYNRLYELERKAKDAYSSARLEFERLSDREFNGLNQKIEALKREIDEASAVLRERCGSLQSGAAQKFSEAENELKDREIDDKTVNRILKETNIERVIGLNVLGKIGIVFILLAVIFFSQFAYGFLTDALKCLFVFVLASAVLAFAIFLQKKRPSVFSISIVSLGISLEYAALSISYFNLAVLNVYVALALCLVLTAGAFLLSTWLKSQTIAAFANVGGYLPLFAIFNDLTLMYGAMVYFLVLNILCFLLASKYKWRILGYTGFTLNFAGILTIAISIGIMLPIQVFTVHHGIVLLFILLSFAIYTVLPVIMNYRKRSDFTKPDFILLIINTLANLVMMNVLFYTYGIGDYTGLLSVFFAACYFALFAVTRRLFKTGQRVDILFWLTGFTFVAMFPPLQFDAGYIAFGWLVESGGLLLFGILTNRKNYARVGGIIGILCLGLFLINDTFIEGSILNNLYLYKYAILTVLSVAVLWSLCYKGYVKAGPADERFRMPVKAPDVYAAAVLLNAALFFIYLFAKIRSDISSDAELSGNIDYLLQAAMIFCCFALSAGVPKIKRLKVKAVHLASLLIGLAALVWLIVLNSLPLLQLGGDASFGQKAAATALVTVLSLMSVYALYDSVKKVFALRGFDSPVLIMLLALYILFTLTHVLLVQYSISITNIAISISYIAVSLICLILGLKRRELFTRRFALILTVVSIIKLCFVDTFLLSLGYRIIAYFAFGVVLIGMSFVYQFFIKKYDISIKINPEPDEVEAEIFSQSENNGEVKNIVGLNEKKD